MPQTLTTERLSLTIDVDFGGRLTSLVDRATGRDWLVPDLVERPVPDAVYDTRFARGWDECFPSVGTGDGRPFGWRGELRDHGDLWGVPTETSLAGNRLTTRWIAEQFVFEREILADGNALALNYRVTNRGPAPFDYLYSQHLLLATRPGDSIALTGIDAITDIDSGSSQPWPIAGLAEVQGIEANIMAKLYGAVVGDVAARVGDATGGINMSWHGDDLPALGLWIDYGGWPVGGPPVHQVAIEPTTAQAHGLTRGKERRLAPGDVHRWSIKLWLD